MSEWITRKLEEIGEIVGGSTPSTKCERYYGGDISWITPKDLATFDGRYISRGERNITEAGLNSCSSRLLPKHSVLFTSRAPIGYIAIAQNELATNQGFKSVVPNEKIDYLFLYYLLKYNKDNIENLGSGTTFKEVSGKTMKSVLVRIPKSLTEQRIIAQILDSLDRKIENGIKLNRNLAAQVSYLYKEWFEDYKPFGGVCPSSWKEGTLSDIASITSGKRPPSKSDKKTISANIPLIGASSVMGYTTEANHIDKILVIGRVGTHGVVQRFDIPCWTSDNTLVITSSLYEYTYQILQRIDYSSMNRGSTQPLITQGDMNKVSILIPDDKTIEKYETFACQLMNLYRTYLMENEKLEELRDSLLPKLMSGELDVSELDV